MTYESFEGSVDSGRPVEVYRFAISADTYDYTSAEDQVVVGGITYSPKAILRGSLRRGPDERTRPLGITLLSDDALARRLVIVPPGQRVTVTLRRIHRDDGATPEARVMFIGFVQSSRLTDDGRSMVLSAYTLEGRMGNQLPRFTFSGSCQHFLYDTGCGVDENLPANKMTSVVTAIAGNTVTVTGAGAFGGGGSQFLAGFLRSPGFDEQRQIVAQSGDVLTLISPFPVSLIGATVDVYRGCDHRITGHCSTRHNNVGRFRGWAFVPKKNIFATGLD